MINCNIDEFNKCEICIKSKMTKQPFHGVERNNNLLDLVLSDICNLNGMYVELWSLILSPTE